MKQINFLVAGILIGLLLATMMISYTKDHYTNKHRIYAIYYQNELIDIWISEEFSDRIDKNSLLEYIEIEGCENLRDKLDVLHDSLRQLGYKGISLLY